MTETVISNTGEDALKLYDVTDSMQPTMFNNNWTDYNTIGLNVLLSSISESNKLFQYRRVNTFATDTTGIEAAEALNINPTSTSTLSINEQNQQHLAFFDKYTKKFIFKIYHTDFEDGFDNEVVLKLRDFFKINGYMTIAWLAKVYSQHQKDEIVVESVLRILTSIDDPNYRYIVLPVIKAGFNDKSSVVQEAAIMVAEKWRTQECLDALETTTFASDWMRSYAETVINELRKELA